MKGLVISRLHFPVESLGPGRRLGLWVQGCSRRCPGCLAPETWPRGRSRLSAPAIMASLGPWLKDCRGLTVSGGEPFEQAEALAEFLRLFRAASQVDVLVYTGFEFEEIEKDLAAFDSLIDALVCGPFQIDRPQTLALRGSDNQSLHLLTELGRRRFEAYQGPWPAGDRPLDLMLDENGSLWLAGIPRPGDLAKIRSLGRGRGA